MKSVYSRIRLFTGILFALAGINSQAAGIQWTNTASGNWTDTIVWTNGVPSVGSPNSAGDVARTRAAGFSVALTGPITMGQIFDPLGSAGSWTVTGAGPVTMDNTGGPNNSAGTANAFIGQTSSGTLGFATENIIIANTDLDIANTGSTTPTLSIGTLGTTTITATTPQSLFIRQNIASASGKPININSSIGGIGSSVITIQNVGTSASVAAMNLNGAVGPNASVVQNAATTVLSLNNGGNNYTGVTAITQGTLKLGVANGIPSTSSVQVDGILNLAGFSDTISALNGAGTINGSSGTPTLTIGGQNGGGTFSGIIQNNGGTVSVAKIGSGTQVMTGQNTYTGSTLINGGILNAGSVANPGVSGPFGGSGTISFGGGTLQFSAVNQNDYSARFSTAANQQISIDTAAQAVTFATPLASSGGSLTKIGNGTLGLTAAETYTGDTAVNGGTLALNSGASLAASSSIAIGAGGTFDVSALPSPYSVGASASLKGSGSGTTIGTVAANIVGASGGTFDAGSQPIVLTWNGASTGTDSTHPSLLVSQGTLNLNGNVITVVVPGTPLAAGVYTLISAPAITGTPNASPSYTGGNGVALGNAGVISVSGSTVILTVSASAGVVGTWNVDADGNWSDGANWSGGVPTAAKDTAIFGIGSALRTVTLNANETVGSLTMNNANSFVIANAGKTLTLDNSGAGAKFSATGGTANAIQTALALNDTLVITVNSGKSLAISGAVGNTGGAKTLTIDGAGTTALSGANTYGPTAGTVGTILNGGGTLSLGSVGALGAGDLSVSGHGTIQAGATVTIPNNIALADTTTVDNNGNDFTLSGAITGAGGLTKIGNHTLTLAGNNLYAGNTTVNGGALSLSSANNVSSPFIILNGGDLLGSATFAVANNIGIGLPSGSAGTNALIDAATGQTFTLNGTIATAGNGGANGVIINSLTANPGTVALGGTNTFTGITVISNGTLELDSPFALQNSSLIYNTGTLTFGNGITNATVAQLLGTNSAKPLILSNGTAGVTLAVGPNNITTAYPGSITDGGVGGGITLNSSGTMTLSNANYSGNTTVFNSGTLVISGGSFGSATSGITIANGGGAATLTITGNANATANTVAVALPGGSTGASLNITGGASGAFTNVQIGSAGNTVGHFTINTTGTVSLGTFVDFKDNSGTANTGTGLIINNGTVTATSITVQNTASGANLNLTGGSLTIGDSTSSGAFVVGNGGSNRGGWLTMSGGSLTYLGVDGLQAGVNAGTATSINISGTNSVATLSGLTLVAAPANSLILSNNASLYLGSVGLVINNPSAAVFALLDNAKLGAIADWSSIAPIALTNNPIIQAGDSNGVPHNITLGGPLSGSGSLAKAGTGTLTLSSTNTFVGNTLVNQGTLAATVVGSISASSNIVVASGATLDVSAFPFIVGANQTVQNGGVINGSVSSVAGARIYAGTDGAYGTNRINNNLALMVGATAYADVGTAFSGPNDLFSVGGALALNVNSLHLKAPGTSTVLDTNTDYVLFTATGGITGSFASTPVWDVAPVNASQFSIVTDPALKQVRLHAYAAGAVPPSAVGSANPSTVYGRQTSVVTVTVTPGSSPVTSVVLDASSYGGPAAIPLVLSGTPNVYTNTITIQPTPTTGSFMLAATVTDTAGSTVVAGIPLTVNPGLFWIGGAGDDNWSSGANWLGGAAPSTSGSILTFAGSVRPTPNMEQNYSIAGLTFDQSATSFTLASATSSTLTLTGNVVNNSPNAQTINLPVDLSGGAQTFNAASNNIIVNGVVSDGGLVKAGTNSLLLTNGNNSFSGGVTLNANSGTVALLGDFSGGIGPISVATNSTLLLGSANASAAASGMSLGGGSALKLRADANTSFTTISPIAVPTVGALTLDVNPLTAAASKTLSLPSILAFGANADQGINVTGNSTYALTLGDITLISASHTPYFNFNVNTLPSGPVLTLGSVTFGTFGNDLNFNGGGRVTVTGNFTPTSNGGINLFVNNGTTATLQGQTFAVSTTPDGNKYAVVNGTLILDDIGFSGNSLINNTTGAGLTRSLFILGAATNVFSGTGYTQPASALTASNNNFNASIYLGATNSTGGMFVNATLTNNVSDGDVGFTNSGTFVIGGLNTSGINTYYNPIILGWTANRGKSVTLAAATGGEVDFLGGLFQNGTDITGGVTIGNGTGFAGIVGFGVPNTYAGPTTINNGTLSLNGGSITNSGVITVNAGATLDATPMGGFTLGTSKAQTLKGRGTIKGGLTVQPNSTLAPGAPAGALTVIGNATLNGLTAMNLNRTNTPVNCSRLSVSGTLIGGGTLTVTNIGPALQVNDTFQLFNGPVSGFTSVVIATNDANNMIYTFENDLATAGSIKVLSATTLVNTNPATANFNFTVAGGSLQFTWAPDHLGWQLYTNAVSLTATNSWFPVPGSAAVTNETLTIVPGATNIFFQLRYP